MKTNRRDFIQWLALIAAGTAARPEQIKAFEQYYDANTPVGNRLVALDEVQLIGLHNRGGMPVVCNFYKQDRIILPAGLNAFGGVYFWRAGPDSKIIADATDIFWKFDPKTPGFELQNDINGTVSYIRSWDRARRTEKLDKLTGSIADFEADA